MAENIASKLMPAVGNNNQGDVAKMLDVAIWLGRHRLEVSGMKTRLVRTIVLHYLADLQLILGRVKDGIRPDSGAFKLLVDAEDKAINICGMFRQWSDQEGNK